MRNGFVQKSKGDRRGSGSAVQQKSRLAGVAWEVTPDVACLPLSLVNVYFLGDRHSGDRGWVLVDAGLAFFDA